MKRKRIELFPLYKELLFTNFSRNIWLEFFYKLTTLFSIFFLSYSILRLYSIIFKIKSYIIFSFYYFSIILFLIVFFIWIYQNYLGKYLRKVDIKTIYESYMILKKINPGQAKYHAKTLEDNILVNEYKSFKVNKNWKFVLIIIGLFIILFFMGSLFSFIQYGKIVYNIIPSESKEVLTMQSIVEKVFDQLDEESDQYKILKKLYEDYTASYTEHGINQKEYLEKLNQILQQSVSLNSTKNFQAGQTGLSNSSSTLTNKNDSKNKETQSKALAQKLMKQEKEEENFSEKKGEAYIENKDIKESFLDFLKSRLWHPDSKKGKGPAGYQAQDIKSEGNVSSDFSTLMQSIYSSSSEFSYSLSNQLTDAQKVEIFNYLLKQFNLNPQNVSFDEELFYKLITLYLEQISNQSKK